MVRRRLSRRRVCSFGVLGAGQNRDGPLSGQHGRGRGDRRDPIPLAVAIKDSLVATVGEEEATFVLGVVSADVHFLAETSRWTGTAEQLVQITDFFESVGEDDDEAGLLDEPDIPEEQALAVLAGLPLIQRASALLQRIGEGKPDTGTGALRVRDIEAAGPLSGWRRSPFLLTASWSTLCSPLTRSSLGKSLSPDCRHRF